MIRFKPISNATAWSGFDWTVADEDQVAELVARVALGQARHVANVLQETNCSAYSPSPTAVHGAISLLTVSDTEKPWHRDGWLFQVLTWIAAHIHSPNTLKAAPHMIHAHKGFDGLQLELDVDNENVISVIICEQKATGNPRGLITSQVWPEFKSFETGRRDNELVAEVAALLDRIGFVDIDQAVGTILWDNCRAYCVSMTVGDNEDSDAGRISLFKDYEKIASERDVRSRRAETFHQPALRKWMDNLSSKAIQAVRRLETELV